MENKTLFVAKFGDLLQSTRELSDLRTLVYKHKGPVGEFVYAVYNNGSQKAVPVTGDSCWSIIADVRDNLSHAAYLSEGEKVSEGDIIANELMSYPKARGYVGLEILSESVAEKANDIFYKRLTSTATVEDFSGHISSLYSDYNDYETPEDYTGCVMAAKNFMASIEFLAMESLEEALYGTFKDEPSEVDAESKSDREYFDRLKSRYSIAEFLGLANAYADDRGDTFRRELGRMAEDYIVAQEPLQCDGDER